MPRGELLAAVHTVAAGDSLLSPSVTRTVIERMAQKPPPDVGAAERLAQLTPREREVLELIARGFSNSEIADELVIEETTVKTHVKRVLMKLRLRDRIQAVIFAYESGLTQPGAHRVVRCSRYAVELRPHVERDVLVALQLLDVDAREVADGRSLDDGAFAGEA